MRRYLFLIALLLVPVAGLAQCTATSPCVQVTVTNPNPLPSSTVLWTCMGGAASSCSQAQLTAAMAGQTATNLCPTSSSAWTCHQFSQTVNPQKYNDPEPYGALMNYAAQATGAGGVSGVSQITIFQVSNPPTQVPQVGSPVLVTTGTVGPQ